MYAPARRQRPSSIAHAIVDLTTQTHALSQQLHRVNHVHGHLQSQLSGLRAQLRELQPSREARGGSSFAAPLSLPQQTQEWSRNTKMLRAKVAEYEDRLQALAAGFSGAEYGVGVEDVVQAERDVLQARHSVAQMEAQLRGFEGLPPDRDAARREVKRLEGEVEALKRERDAVFAAMVGE